MATCNLSWNNGTKFQKRLGTTVPLEKGNVDQKHKNHRMIAKKEEKEDFFSSPTKEKRYDFFVAIVTTKLNNSRNKQKAYSNQTGCLPHKFSRGNQYLFILYDFDGNVILAELLKIRKSKEIVNVSTKYYDRLTSNGHEVKK